jgi:H+/Cl- antiporter ClcA
MFLIGGIIGRLYGILMLKWFGITRVIEFSVVGSACMVSSVTHTLAITVITFELVGEIYILYEVLIGVIVTYAISKYFSPSIYHVSIELKNLPFLP